MWSELFCRGDDPPTAIRWSQPSVATASGLVLSPSGLQVTYPGGSEWERLDVVVDPVGVCQITNRSRTTPHDSVVTVPSGLARSG
jgi:hypothetical protein